MKGQSASGPGPRPPWRDRYAGFCCWGYGEFGQNCHGGSGGKDNVRFEEGDVKKFNIAGERIKFMSCGASHTVVVTARNMIYTWGNGNSGQLGCGETGTKFEPIEVVLNGDAQRPVVQGVSTGGRHTFLWLENGNMYSWGNNFYAQLGYDFRIPNYKENQGTPHLLRTLTYRPVVEVSCGQKHTILLFKDGTVAVLGNNAHGQVGDGTRTEAAVPKALEYLPTIKTVRAGSNHNIVITEHGKIYAWGHGKGCGKRRGDVLEPIPLPMRLRAKQVAAGQFHSLALTDSGVVYSWGHGAGGQLGHGDNISQLESPRRIRSKNLPRPVIQVACGENYCSAITASGALYMWGKNSHVIVSDFSSTHVIPYPQRVNPVNKPVAQLACGAWHASVILGLPATFDEYQDSRTIAEKDASLALTGANSWMQADRCTQTSRLSHIQSLVSVTSEVSDASSLSEDDSLDDPQEILQDLLRPSPYPTSGPEGPIRSITLAEFYAASPSPLPRMTGAGFNRPVENMEGSSAHIKRSSLGFPSEDGHEWRPAFPSLGNGHGDSDVKDTASIALSSSRTSLNTIDPSNSFSIQGHSTSRAPNFDNSGATEHHGEIYTSAGLNQGIIQLSKSRSADFVLPRERTGFHSQNLDVATLPPAEPNPSPRHRFHIDQHVSVHLTSRTGSSTSSSKASSSGSSTAHSSSNGTHEHISSSRQNRIQAPHVAFRRSRTVHGMHKSSTNKPKRAPSEDRLPESPTHKDGTQEFALMVPRTLSFVASDGPAEGSDQITARISISNKKSFGTRKGDSGALGLGIMSEKTFLERRSQQSQQQQVNGRRKPVAATKLTQNSRSLGQTSWNTAQKPLSSASDQNWSEGSSKPQPTTPNTTILVKQKDGLIRSHMKAPRTARKEKPSRR